MPATVEKVRDDLLLKLGVSVPADATPGQLADVAVAINWALQTMHTAGEDFFTRRKLAVTYPGGGPELALPEEVQSVLGPVRLATGAHLRALESRGEYDAYGPLFMGLGAYAVPNGTPQAYWVETHRADDATDADLAKINIRLIPQPGGNTDLEVEGVEEAANYAVADLGYTDPLPCPHKYVETIFLPLARYAITRSNDFSRAELRAELEKDFRFALSTLGLKGGFPPEKKPEMREVVA